jgi:hypothetical protein
MIIIEGKLEDLSKKYIPQFNTDDFTEGLTPESVIEHLYVSDPSPTKKYFEWMIKECLGLIKSNYIISNEKVGRLVNDIQEFDRNIDKLSEDFLEYNKEEIGDIAYKYLKDKPLKDINTYNVDILRKIIPTLIKHKTESQRRVLAKEGAKLVYQNDNYKVYEIDTWDASCFYGSGSRWCTTNKLSDNHFRSYGTGSNKLLYVISKTKTKESDPQFYKIAINVRYGDERITFWDAPDDPFNGWIYFSNEDPNILTFLVNYVKEKNPENYLKMLPDGYIISIKQKEEGLTDLQIVQGLSEGKSTKWLIHKYGLSQMDAIIKKLDILNGNISDFLGGYFTNDEKVFLLTQKNGLLESRELTWKDLVKSYHELAITFDSYSPSWFIENFLDGDKNKVLEIGTKEPIILYWLAKGGEFVNDLGNLYGAEKIVKYITKNKPTAIFSLTSILPGLFTNETPKKKRELYEIAYNFDKLGSTHDLSYYLASKMGYDSFIASFNKGSGSEIEPDSYRRAFLYLKNNNPDVISDVFGVKDIVKIFKTEEKAFTYFLKNYDEFSSDGLDISDLTEMFSGDVPDSIFGKYMSNWEKTNAISTYRMIEGSKKLFNFVLKKFSFKKLADIVGYDEVFQLFSIVGFKKGINYMIENKIGDIRIDDIRIQDGKVVLIVNDRSEYAFLFDEEITAENILGEDGLDWTPYDDVIYDWYVQVWGCVTPKSIELVKAWIKSNVAEYENDEGDEIDLGDTYLNEIDDDDLGKIIDEYDEFEELKRELSWAYDSAYNSVAQSDIINSTQNQLEEYLGGYIGYEPVKLSKTRYNKETGNYEKYEYSDYIYLYNAGDSLYDMLYEYAATNWGYPVDYNTYFRSLLKESDPKKLYIDTDSYPDSGEVCKYFNEDLPGRI